MNGLTAWERWELTTFDADATPPATDAEAEPVQLSPEEVERICTEARQDGHRTGYASGQAAAKAEAVRLAQAADGLEKALLQFDQQVADELLALAAEIARQVIRAELSARPDIILNIVNEALTQLPHQHATIYLHPDDASLIRSYAGDALAHAGHRILEEPKLNPGDCVLEAGGSQLDASLATRWRRVVASLGLTSAWNEPEGQ